MNITILGGGAYGQALANCFIDNNNNITIWNKFEHELENIRKKYLNITLTTNIEQAINTADLIVIAIPIPFIETTIIELQNNYQGQNILIASKGIDTKSQKFAFEIIKNHLPNAKIGIISGGTFAEDMNKKVVMGLTLATTEPTIKEKIKQHLANRYLKIQYTNDYIGISLCGAIKNVMAIGFGLLDGASFPPSTKFLFLTEAIYEIKNLIINLGGNPDTILTYAGIDDIMMTCTSSQSRNYTLGKMIGQNKSTQEIEEYKNTTTIEGLSTSHAIYKLSTSKNINLPICTTIYQILYENKPSQDLINLLEKKN